MNDEGGLSDDENVPDCWEELITNCSENSLSEEEEREEHEEEEDYVLFMSDVHIINSSHHTCCPIMGQRRVITHSVDTLMFVQGL